MADWDDVKRIALALAQTDERVSRRLDRIAVDDLDEVITEAWLARAPKRLAQAFLGARG